MFRIAKYLFLLPLSIFAFEVQRDFQDSFIFTDKVASLDESPCESDILFITENVSFLGEFNTPGVPFRTYTIAIPNSTPPNVEVENLKTETLKGKPCGAEKYPRALKIGEPYLKDNLWRVEVSVPLVYSSGNSWNLRRNFRVKINFNGQASGISVGKRALAFVDNKSGANRFGTRQGTRAAILRKPDAGIDWLAKIGVGNPDLSLSADGMYAVSFDDLKRAMREAGRENDIDGITISQLRLFGASPDTVPEFIAEEIFPNWKEIPIQVKDKNNNGIFDSGDTIVFFGYGTSIWKQSKSASGMDYYFSHSPYSFYQYFYLGAGGQGKRLNAAEPKNLNGKDIAWKKYARSAKNLLLRDNYFSDRAIEENTGKEWFWVWGDIDKTVSVNSSEFQNSIRNLNGIQGDSAWIGVSFFPRRSTRPTPLLSSRPLRERMRGINFNFYFQNQQLQNADIKDTLLDGSFVFASNRARATDNPYRLEILPGDQNDRFTGISLAYYYNPSLSPGDEWLFPGQASGEVRIPVPANMELIKTENFIPTEIMPTANNYAQDEIPTDSDIRYFLSRKNIYKTPAHINGIVKRADAISDPLNIPHNTEYIILTSEILQNSAIKLKQFRESGEASTRLNTAVVLVEDIYKLHGAHSSPVAIRDFLRYAKKHCDDLRYVLLAGSGYYDYRKIRQGAKDNIVPPYQAEDTSTDDFFVILDPGEVVRFGNYRLSMAIGRLPVSSVAEFENYIQKVREHESVSIMNNGIWRNTIIFTADDALQGTREDAIPHTGQMEATATQVNSLSREQNFAMEMRKISLLQYDIDGSGKKPEATKELLLRLNQGALFTFFYGHGNAVMWADEDLLNVSSLDGLFNTGRYTILGSFSCMVSRFDDFATISLSEAFVNAKSRGAIASIGALRVAYADPNVILSRNFLTEALFTPNILLGEAFLRAKEKNNSQYRYNNEKYVLLGEPVLSMPKREIELELDNPPDTIQALQRLKISGTASIETGFVRMQILEGEKSRALKQKNCEHPQCSTTIKVPGSPIYSEELQIRDRKFSTEFVTPRKLSLGDTSAEIRLWAYRPGTLGIGKFAKNDILLDGTSGDFIEDNTPPSIKIYPCMRSGIAAPFEENAHVSLEIPACLNVVIEDSTGLDYREEADEGIFFQINNEPPWHPWSFSEQTGRRAAIRMDFGSSYDPGEYIFKVHAQDILGNAAVRSIRISLSQDNKAGLADVFNIPNPMKRSGTTFYFKDLSGDRQSNVSIRIFDQNGKLVKTINNAISGVTHWDGRDSRGRLLANGLYHYVVQNTVSSLDGNSKRVFEKKQKLVISR
ncbi:MAG: C25 family cysteine peptidase [Fibromonadaceae bacterium]|nr:C25 family cysteine peptidase [Fibromonadaceae bacterium]